MGRRRTRKVKHPSLSELYAKAGEAIKRGDKKQYKRAEEKIHNLEHSRKRVTREFIELANYEFDHSDLQRSWSRFHFMLKNECRIIQKGRPDLIRSDIRKPPDDLLEVQAVIRRALKGIAENGEVPRLTFKEMIDHAEDVGHTVTDGLSDDGSLRRYTVAKEYHDVLYWEIVSIDRTRIKKCSPECRCGLYFWDSTKNKSQKHYPGHDNRVRQRRFRAVTG